MLYNILATIETQDMIALFIGQAIGLAAFFYFFLPR